MWKKSWFLNAVLLSDEVRDKEECELFSILVAASVNVILSGSVLNPFEMSRLESNPAILM